jgi:hypothetical protein
MQVFSADGVRSGTVMLPVKRNNPQRCGPSAPAGLALRAAVAERPGKRVAGCEGDPPVRPGTEPRISRDAQHSSFRPTVPQACNGCVVICSRWSGSPINKTNPNDKSHGLSVSKPDPADDVTYHCRCPNIRPIPPGNTVIDALELIEIGAKIVSRPGHTMFQLATDARRQHVYDRAQPAST